jgi:hypothetical protein
MPMNYPYTAIADAELPLLSAAWTAIMTPYPAAIATARTPSAGASTPRGR